MLVVANVSGVNFHQMTQYSKENSIMHLRYLHKASNTTVFNILLVEPKLLSLAPSLLKIAYLTMLFSLQLPHLGCSMHSLKKYI